MLNPADSALLDAIRGTRWPARKLVGGRVMGMHLSSALGPSSEFTEYRAYRQGDETRRIDWKLLARTDRAYIRLAQDHSALTTMVLLDASASMSYPQPALTKWHCARQVALGLAAATHRSGDPVGIRVACAPTSESPVVARQLAARSRSGVVHEIAHLLREVTPSGMVALASHLRALRSSGRVAIVSDFLADAEAQLDVAGQLCSQGREVYAIHIIDVSELNPSREATLLTDPEDAELVRSMSETAYANYKATFAQWREQLARRWMSRGAYYTQVVTDEAVPSALRRITHAASLPLARNA